MQTLFPENGGRIPSAGGRTLFPASDRLPQARIRRIPRPPRIRRSDVFRYVSDKCPAMRESLSALFAVSWLPPAFPAVPQRIGAPEGAADTVSGWTAFRRDVRLDEAPSRAVARIAVDSKYWLWWRTSPVRRSTTRCPPHCGRRSTPAPIRRNTCRRRCSSWGAAAMRWRVSDGVSRRWSTGPCARRFSRGGR